VIRTTTNVSTTTFRVPFFAGAGIISGGARLRPDSRLKTDMLDSKHTGNGALGMLPISRPVGTREQLGQPKRKISPTNSRPKRNPRSDQLPRGRRTVGSRRARRAPCPRHTGDVSLSEKSVETKKPPIPRNEPNRMIEPRSTAILGERICAGGPRPPQF